MKEQIAEYVISLYRDIPVAIYEGLLSVLFLGAVVIIVCYGLKRGWRKIAGLLLVGYVFVIYCSTVIFRKVSEGAGHEFKPFWSYEAIHDGRQELLIENIMNVVVFIPVGMILGSWPRNGSWFVTLMTGMIISITIETLQFYFMRGFSEVDDVMHNTVGCLIGWLMVKGSRFMMKDYNKFHS